MRDCQEQGPTVSGLQAVLNVCFQRLQCSSFYAGKPARLTHPADMFGFSCGEINSWQGIEVDLRGRGEARPSLVFLLTDHILAR